MIPWRKRALALSAAGLLAGTILAPCAGARDEGYRTRMRLQMGSLTEITVPAEDYAQGPVSRAFDAIDRLERLLSTYKADSEISRLARSGRLAVSPETMEITRAALRLSRLTGGAFNPLLGPVIRLWREAEARQQPPTAAELSAALRLADIGRVELDSESGTIVFGERGMGLNFGAIGKGFALDKAAAVLRAAGIASALLASGGSSHRMIGRPVHRPCWELAIRHPADPERLVALLRTGPAGAATSAQDTHPRKIAGRSYGRIIDARTGEPARPNDPVWSATVLARDAATADALSTALIAMEAAAGLRLVESMPGVEALLVRKGPGGRPVLVVTGGLIRLGEADGLPLVTIRGDPECLSGRAEPSALSIRGHLLR